MRGYICEGCGEACTEEEFEDGCHIVIQVFYDENGYADWEQRQCGPVIEVIEKGGSDETK